MIKNLIGGIAVGIANVIPGVSGGTMMVILRNFLIIQWKLFQSIFQKENDHRKGKIYYFYFKYY